MLMRLKPEKIIRGQQIMRHALQARRCIIALEENKPEAFRALQAAAAGEEGVEVVQVPTLYPAGSEKQLIKVLTGREVPANGLSAHIGVVSNNVATAAAVHHAIDRGEPMIKRYVTVTGGAVAAPQNLKVLLGTPVAHLLAACGGDLDRTRSLIMGGPMMGFALHDPRVPVIKTTNCILAATPEELAPTEQVMPCIRCGACATACPINLLPQQLYWYARSKDFEQLQDYNLFDCIECGCCAYVCPSHIPLVQYYRFAKGEIATQERERRKADIARQRHQFRMERLAREKAERAERLKKKKAAALAAAAGKAQQEKGRAARDAAVARAAARRRAALERIRERGESGMTDGAPDTLTAVKARLSEAAEARHRHDQSGGDRRPPTDSSDQDK